MLDARSGVLRNLMTNFGAECTHFHLQTQIIWGKSRIDDVTKKREVRGWEAKKF